MDCANRIRLNSGQEIVRFPVMGTFELTVRCNLHCKMCLFRHSDSENYSILEHELTASEWINLAKEVAEAGTIQLLITGGEPMLRRDFCEIWEGIYEQGFLTTLYTNATLVTPEIMETLRKCPPNKIGVTIYGARPETYQKVCGDEKAFERAMEGIRQLMTLPSSMEFRTTIIKDNYPEAIAIDDLVHEQFGEEYNVIQTRIVTKSVRGACADVESCRLDPSDNIKLSFIRGVEKIKKIVGDTFDESNLSIEPQQLGTDNVMEPKISLFGCDAGMKDYTISWDGKMIPCQMFDLYSIDIKKESFQEAWNRFPAIVKQPKMDPECLSCRDKDLCSCCVASRYAETGNPGGRPDYVCRDVKALKAWLER